LNKAANIVKKSQNENKKFSCGAFALNQMLRTKKYVTAKNKCLLVAVSVFFIVVTASNKSSENSLTTYISV
jgi:hypothetical protein